MQYNPSETNLPKWTQQLLDELRAENIRLREKASAALAAHIVKLDRDWFVMPGPSGGAPAIRLWILSEDGPKMNKLQPMLVCPLFGHRSSFMSNVPQRTNTEYARTWQNASAS